MKFEIINFQSIEPKSFEECSICIQPLENKVIGHKIENNDIYHCFHKKCLKEWIATNPDNPKCPLCNRLIVISLKTSLTDKVSSAIRRMNKAIPYPSYHNFPVAPTLIGCFASPVIVHGNRYGNRY